MKALSIKQPYALCIVNLVDCHPFTRADIRDAGYDVFGFAEDEIDVSGFAWVFEDIREIEPFPVKGKLNLFNVELPQEEPA